MELQDLAWVVRLVCVWEKEKRVVGLFGNKTTLPACLPIH